MKMMLSTPRTISSSVSVASATHASGEVIHSIDERRSGATIRRWRRSPIRRALSRASRAADSRRSARRSRRTRPACRARRCADRATSAISTGVLPHFAVGTSPPSLALVSAALWSGAHQTRSAFAHDSVFGPVRGIEQVVNFDAERRDLVDLAMELTAVAAIDVGEDRDGVLDLTVLRLEHDHALRIDALRASRRARVSASLLGDVRARCRRRRCRRGRCSDRRS